MKKINLYSLLLILGVMITLTSCFKDLDTLPLDPDELTPDAVYADPANYKRVLAKVYGGLALSGQSGPAGNSDVFGLDEGFGQYLRGLFYHQELCTDEAVIGWNDRTIKDFHDQDWDANDGFIAAFYSRIFYQVSLCNEFIRESTDAKLDSRGIQGNIRDEIKQFRAEARFLRALSYYHALDHFRNVPFVTELDGVGSFFPKQIQAGELFTYIESELKAIEGDLAAPRSNEYGRADQAAAWTLLAKLYLNAEVYTGTPRYNDAAEYSQRVINSGYSLEPNYQHLFLADNHLSNEIIFPVVSDALTTQSFGAMTFIVKAQVGGSMSLAEFGISDGWGGLRTTKQLVSKFTSGASGEIIKAPNPGNLSYPVLYAPGSYQGWDPTNTSTVLASQNVDGNYEGYFYFPEAGTQFKFADGPSWDVNYGDNGADGTLDQGGDNIQVADAGFYRVLVNLNDLTYSINKTSWGIIGSATAGQWDSDQDMTYDVATNSLVFQGNLSPGEMKFRANDDWALNYGDSGFDGLLEPDGANIPITQGGNYIVRLYLDKPDHTYSLELLTIDGRALFYTDGQQLEIDDISEFKHGYAVAKYKNVTSTGAPASGNNYIDTDFPMFRLGDVYLIYAEAVLRGGNGSMGDALMYVNALRERAYSGSGGNISQSELTLDFILDERARELLFECQRRTDLVRFGKFSNTDYHWAWKGGVKEGRAVSSHFDVYPIPNSDIGANPTLQQNHGY